MYKDNAEPGRQPDHTMQYLFIYQPPQEWDLAVESRDRLVETGNVLRIIRSSLNSLQFTEMRLDSITRRPLGVIMLGVSDRYGYAAGGSNGKGRSFEAFAPLEVETVHEAALVAKHYRRETYYTRRTRALFEKLEDREPSGWISEPMIRTAWVQMYTGRIGQYQDSPDPYRESVPVPDEDEVVTDDHEGKPV